MSDKTKKTVYAREIRHIIANFNIKSAPTGYRRNSKSAIYKSIHDMIKWNWVECKNVKGQFMFVSPTTYFISNIKIIL
jgi:hypothetical protein